MMYDIMYKHYPDAAELISDRRIDNAWIHLFIMSLALLGFLLREMKSSIIHRVRLRNLQEHEGHVTFRASFSENLRISSSNLTSVLSLFLRIKTIEQNN